MIYVDFGTSLENVNSGDPEASYAKEINRHTSCRFLMFAKFVYH